MKCSLHTCFLLALLTLSLPFALTGCNSSTDSSMTSSATPAADTNTPAPAPAAPAADTNAPAAATNAPSTNTPAATTNGM